MKVLLLILAAVTLAATASWEDTENFNNVADDPLNAEYYGLNDNDGSLEDDSGTYNGDEPLSDIENILDDIVDVMDEEDIVVETEEQSVVQDVDDDKEGGIGDDEISENDYKNIRKKAKWNRKRKQMWRKTGRKTSRKVSRYMKKHNIDDMSEVPKRKFKGPLRKMHKLANQNGEDRIQHGHMKKMYKKITKHVQKKISGVNKKLEGICQRIKNRTEPRRKVLQKIPQDMKQEFLSMFNKRREELLTCCEQETENKTSCFVDAHKSKLDDKCSIMRQNKQSNNNNWLGKRWQNKAHCCEMSDTESRNICLRKAKHSMKNHKKASRHNPEARLAATCRKLKKSKAPLFKKLFSKMSNDEAEKWRKVFAKRREEMKLCCEHQTTNEKMACAIKLKMERINRVCAGEEELKPGIKHKPRHTKRVDSCCQLQENERWDCFTKRHHKGNRDEEVKVEIDIEQIEEEFDDKGEYDGNTVENIPMNDKMRDGK